MRMYEFPLDDIHRMLDTIDIGIRKIGQIKTTNINLAQIWEVSEVILEVLGSTNTAYIENDLGISPSHLSKFVKMRGSINKSQALAVAQRVRTYLKSLDQATPRSSNTPHAQSQQEPKERREEPRIAVAASQWIAIRQTSEIKLKIGVISSPLDSIIEQAAHANVAPEDQAISELEKHQLIAILETALNLLRSPLVEKGLLKKAEESLADAGKKAVQKGIQEGLGKLMTAASSRIGELVLYLWTRQ
jgi:hypothetical protein